MMVIRGRLTRLIADLIDQGIRPAEIAAIAGTTPGTVNAVKARLRGYERPSIVKRRAERARANEDRLAEMRKMPGRIPLTRGLFALIDESDFDLVAPYRWNAHDEMGLLYAIGSRGMKMHRLILAAPKGVLVDHRNGNGLDNRRENIRLCDHSQNSRNSRPVATSSSRFRGVYWYRATEQWTGQITAPDGRRISIGYHDSEEDAARARDALARDLHGEFAFVNLPVPITTTRGKRMLSSIDKAAESAAPPKEEAA